VHITTVTHEVEFHKEKINSKIVNYVVATVVIIILLLAIAVLYKFIVRNFKCNILSDDLFLFIFMLRTEKQESTWPS